MVISSSPASCILFFPSLVSKFTGDLQTSDLVLSVRVFKGSAVMSLSRTWWLASSRRGEFGCAKLTVSSCLFSRKSGKVVMTKQLCCGINSLSAVQWPKDGEHMAHIIGEKTCRETTFVTNGNQGWLVVSLFAHTESLYDRQTFCLKE
jgi:hypothetical protein